MAIRRLVPGTHGQKILKRAHLFLAVRGFRAGIVAVIFIASGFFVECTGMDFRKEMRAFVGEIGAYARELSPGFIIVPQNGHHLLTRDGLANGPLAQSYVRAIDGLGRESLFFGQDGDDSVTDPAGTREVAGFLDIGRKNGLSVLVIDYCFSTAKVEASYARNREKGYVSFAAPDRSLSTIPRYPLSPFSRNNSDVTKLDKARNFLCLINPEDVENKESFVRALAATDFDLLIIDLFVHDETLDAGDLALLKRKKSGGVRLVLAYMSIGEAEDYRYYWDEAWNEEPPEFLGQENPDWAGNYKVRYWDKNWKAVISGSEDSYTARIVRAGFDGVYLDIIDAYEYFEELGLESKE